LILTASRPICGKARPIKGFAVAQQLSLTARYLTAHYQLFFQPAVTLLLVAPCAVSPTEPEMVTPSESFCSAPILRSHLSSPDDRLWPAVTLVPVLPMSSLADWSVA
jgi:hypothetical protein